MARKVVTLSSLFNEVTVKRGQVFRIEAGHVGGGFAGEYQEFTVVTGKARQVADPSTTHPQYGADQFVRFKALEKGDIEIVSERMADFRGTPTGQKTTYKIHVI
jgi:hypothetical protein